MCFLVTSTANELFIGWVDSIYGPMTIMAIILGLQRYQLENGNVEINMVPVVSQMRFRNCFRERIYIWPF